MIASHLPIKRGGLNSSRAFIYAAAAVLFAATAPLDAQQATPEAKETPPPGPLVQKRADEFSCWSVSLKPPGDLSKQAPSSAKGKDKAPRAALQTTSFVKTGNIVRVVFDDTQDKVWDVWMEGSVQVLIWPDKKSVGRVEKPVGDNDFNPFYVNLSDSDFPGFEWISADNYTGVKTVLGKKCLTFKDKLKATSGSMRDNGVVIETTAVVDLDSRLPVALTNGSGLFVYKFLPPPTAMQTLPEPVQTFINGERQKTQALTRLPGTPY